MESEKSGQLLRHIVAFKYNDRTSEEGRKKVVEAFRSLKNKIPYLVSLESGENINEEPVLSTKLGFKDVFILTFKTEADLQFYLNEDPEHLQFKSLAGPYLRNGGEVIALDLFARL